MALSKTVVVDKIEVLEMGQLQVRTATVVSEDGGELTRAFHRHVLEPGDDTSGQAVRVAAIAAATWTVDVLDAWAEAVAAREVSLVG